MTVQNSATHAGDQPGHHISARDVGWEDVTPYHDPDYRDAAGALVPSVFRARLGDLTVTVTKYRHRYAFTETEAWYVKAEAADQRVAGGDATPAAAMTAALAKIKETLTVAQFLALFADRRVRGDGVEDPGAACSRT
jgi:hypothetical protein